MWSADLRIYCWSSQSSKRSKWETKKYSSYLSLVSNKENPFTYSVPAKFLETNKKNFRVKENKKFFNTTWDSLTGTDEGEEET